MSHELYTRNRLIYARKHRDKKSYKEISQEFGITETRIRQILAQQTIERRYENLPVNQHIYEIEEACKRYGASKTMRGRIYNALANAGVLKRKRWLSLSTQDLMEIRNLGPKAVSIIQIAQDIYINN